MPARTHLRADPSWCGKPIELAEGTAHVELIATPEMVVDEQGLVHGGFVFGAADYAAMLAVNDPNVVLGSAEARFVAPVTVGAKVVAAARTVATDGRRRDVEVTAHVGENKVFEGRFQCFVLERHVLDKAGS